MENIAKLLPLLALIVVAIFFIRSGSKTKPDAEKNKADIGGGSGGSHTID